jgi:methionyl aminopeptidase
MGYLNETEVASLREAGNRLAFVLQETASLVVPGVSTLELDAKARELIEVRGDKPAFLNYQPSGADRPYPATLCTSVNDEVVHGIPNENPYTLVEGDIITIDAGLVHDGVIADMALTVAVGDVDKEAHRLIEATIEARAVAIAMAVPGKTTGDIGHAVTQVAQKYGYSVVKELGGHGVGRHVHEEPFIPNEGHPGSGTKIEDGMTLAIEPILCEGSGEVYLDDDGYTYKTEDGSRTAQFEHTILVTKNGPEILTIAN